MSRASLFWLNGKFKASIIGQNFPIVRFFWPNDDRFFDRKNGNFDLFWWFWKSLGQKNYESCPNYESYSSYLVYWYCLHKLLTFAFMMLERGVEYLLYIGVIAPSIVKGLVFSSNLVSVERLVESETGRWWHPRRFHVDAAFFVRDVRWHSLSLLNAVFPLREVVVEDGHQRESNSSSPDNQQNRINS